MDHILVEGDSLYKRLGTLDMLSTDQLPGIGKIYSPNIPAPYARLETRLATLTFGDSFVRHFFRENPSNSSTTLSLLFMEDFTNAIIFLISSNYLIHIVAMKED